MREEMNIQWFPGHMTKARRMIEDMVKQVDGVCEIVDARIPASSRNPDLDSLTGGRPRLIIMNRTDQADPNVTAAWETFFRKQHAVTLKVDARSGRGTERFPAAVRELLSHKIEEYRAKGQTGRRLRVMVVGIPNVGKSTFINKIAGHRAAEVSDRPGVTKSKQWVAVDAGIDLLDTPGILWPKFESQTVGENLAFTGAVKDEILDRVTLGANLMLRLRDEYPDRICSRYKFTPSAEADGFELLEQAAAKRGFLLRGGEYDLERMAAVLLDEFRGGKLGRITLESPPEGS